MCNLLLIDLIIIQENNIQMGYYGRSRGEGDIVPE